MYKRVDTIDIWIEATENPCLVFKSAMHLRNLQRNTRKKWAEMEEIMRQEREEKERQEKEERVRQEREEMERQEREERQEFGVYDKDEDDDDLIHVKMQLPVIDLEEGGKEYMNLSDVNGMNVGLDDEEVESQFVGSQAPPSFNTTQPSSPPTKTASSPPHKTPSAAAPTQSPAKTPKRKMTARKRVKTPKKKTQPQSKPNPECNPQQGPVPTPTPVPTPSHVPESRIPDSSPIPDEVPVLEGTPQSHFIPTPAQSMKKVSKSTAKKKGIYVAKAKQKGDTEGSDGIPKRKVSQKATVVDEDVQDVGGRPRRSCGRSDKGKQKIVEEDSEGSDDDSFG